MPVVRIHDATFGDLKSIATWFGTITPGDTIDRIVRDTMERLGMERDLESEASPTTASVDAAPTTTKFEHAPRLAFTRLRSASVGGKAVLNPRWSSVLATVIAQVKAKGFEGEKLVRELRVPSRAAEYRGEGFTYHPDLGISIQGQSASDAWKEADRLAKKWRIPVTVEFRWQNNPKVLRRGQTGVLRSGHA